MKDIFIQIREKVVSRMKYIPSFPIDYNAITVFIGFDRVDQLGQPIQREVDRKNSAEVLQKALEACDDDILRLAINLAFSCSLRMGELLGLTWDLSLIHIFCAMLIINRECLF